MRKPTRLGDDFTGAQMSPEDNQKQIDWEHSTEVPGDASALAMVYEEVTLQGGELGSVPVPGSVKGVLKATFDKVLGNNPDMLIDKLGERLAFERTGVRLYEALIAKAAACETAGPELIPTFNQMRDDEHAHMFLLIDAMQSLGADPAAHTPGARLTEVLSAGMLRVITDPATNMAQALNAMLTAELTDHAGWEILIQLANDNGHASIGSSFANAVIEAQRHVNTIRSLLVRELGITGY